MALVRPLITDTFTSYEGDKNFETTVSLAIKLIDDFTGETLVEGMRLVLNEKSGQIPNNGIKGYQPLRNTSGYFCFTDLPPQQYTLVIEPDLLKTDRYLLPSNGEEGEVARSLEREVQIPVDELFEFKNSTNLAVRLRDAAPSDPVSLFLKGEFSSATQDDLDDYDGSNPPPKTLQNALIKEINQILEGVSIYEEDRFSQIPLSTETQELLERDPQGKELVHLNRLLLADAYPKDIGKSQENPIVIIPLYPKPSYRFPMHATLVQGRVFRREEEAANFIGIEEAVIRTSYLIADPDSHGNDTPIQKNIMTLTDTKGYYVLYFKNVAIGNQEITVRAKAEGALEKEIKFRIKEGKVINAIDFDFSQ